MFDFTWISAFRTDWLLLKAMRRHDLPTAGACVASIFVHQAAFGLAAAVTLSLVLWIARRLWQRSSPAPSTDRKPFRVTLRVNSWRMSLRISSGRRTSLRGSDPVRVARDAFIEWVI